MSIVISEVYQCVCKSIKKSCFPRSDFVSQGRKIFYCSCQQQTMLVNDGSWKMWISGVKYFQVKIKYIGRGF